MSITRRGVELPKLPGVMDRVRAELRVSPFAPQNPFPRHFRVYHETPASVVVPLHWARAAFPDVRLEDRRAPGEAASLRFAGVLRPELRQLEAARAVQDAWRERGGAMLCLDCGLGKTVTALYLACQLGKKALVVVHKQFLADQWEERIREFVPRARVSHVRGAQCDTSGDFVVAMLQTLVSRQHPPAVFEPCGLLIFDEVHHAAAEVFSQSMWSMCMPYTLGLTATPDRRDRLGRVVEWFMGGVAFRLKRENQASTRVRVLKYACPRYAEPPPTNRRGDVCFTTVVSRIAEDPERTEVVARAAHELTREGHHVLVLSHRRAHCLAISEAVARRGVGCATYLGGDKEAPDTTVVVATYALTSEGFDCPRLTALVLATPASDVEQSCGRVMRGSSDREAVIVDVVDQWGVCFAQHAKRRAFYRKGGFRVTTCADGTGDEAADEAADGPARAWAFLDD